MPILQLKNEKFKNSRVTYKNAPPESKYLESKNANSYLESNYLESNYTGSKSVEIFARGLERNPTARF